MSPKNKIPFTLLLDVTRYDEFFFGTCGWPGKGPFGLNFTGCTEDRPRLRGTPNTSRGLWYSTSSVHTIFHTMHMPSCTNILARRVSWDIWSSAYHPNDSLCWHHTTDTGSKVDRRHHSSCWPGPLGNQSILRVYSGPSFSQVLIKYLCA